MFEVLKEAERYIRLSYREIAGVDSWSEASSPDCISPVWKWQDADLRNIADPNAATGFLVLDEAVGACVYVQIYSGETDVVSQVSKALRIRSGLLPGRVHEPKDGDADGDWAVSLHWLIEKADFSSWINKIAPIRQDTAYFEEVSVDAIVNSDSDWSAALKFHQLPRLQLQVRAAIAHQGLSDARAWADANTILQSYLDAVPDELSGEDMASYVSEYREELARHLNRVDEPLSSGPSIDVRSLHIENFRNIKRMSMVLRPQSEDVSANVVHGPNGSGKSGIVEALSIAMASTSHRYIDYLLDGNVSKKPQAADYIKNYLSPLRSPGLGPRVSVNSDVLKDVQLVEAGQAQAALRGLAANIYVQSPGGALVNRSAAELGADIAGSYSTLALSILAWADSKLAASTAVKEQMNRNLSIRSNTRREETARTRIIEGKIASAPKMPEDVHSWLTDAPQRFIDGEAKAIAEELRRQGEAETARIGALHSSPSRSIIRQGIQEILESRDRSIRRTAIFLNRARAAKEIIADDLPENINRWAQWLRTRQRTGQQVEASATQQLRDTLQSAQNRQEGIVRSGTALRERIKHFEASRAFFDAHWFPSHSPNCPTCNTSFESVEELRTAIEEAQKVTNREIAEKRTEYGDVQREIARLSGELQASGVESPPASGDVMPVLKQIFGDPAAFIDLTQDDQLSEIVSTIRWAKRVPLTPVVTSDTPIERQADSIAGDIWVGFEVFAENTVAPERWLRLRNAISNAFLKAIEEHLPRRLQALWLELAMSITPAPWQYPGRIGFAVSQEKGETHARIVVKDSKSSPLAAHLLNSAEIHTLSVAWFLTRYLTWGRFQSSLMALDDPAQQMDQPTFRDLCRLLQAIARLHRQAKKRFTLLMFLHQDERALDAARALNGTLHMLRWNNETDVVRQSKRMRAETILPRKAYNVVGQD